MKCNERPGFRLRFSQAPRPRYFSLSFHSLYTILRYTKFLRHSKLKIAEFDKSKISKGRGVNLLTQPVRFSLGVLGSIKFQIDSEFIGINITSERQIILCRDENFKKIHWTTHCIFYLSKLFTIVKSLCVFFSFKSFVQRILVTKRS